MTRRSIPLSDRLRRMSVPDSAGCWMWQGRPSNRGYGQITVYTETGVRNLGAHRAAYETFVGPIPDGLVIDHLCRKPLCINQEHLEAVSQRENLMRSPVAIAKINAGKTCCPKGHPYDVQNTRLSTRSNGTTRMRACRRCAAERDARAAVSA